LLEELSAALPHPSRSDSIAVARDAWGPVIPYLLVVEPENVPELMQDQATKGRTRRIVAPALPLNTASLLPIRHIGSVAGPLRKSMPNSWPFSQR
jgi:hypothetical protein